MFETHVLPLIGHMYLEKRGFNSSPKCYISDIKIGYNFPECYSWNGGTKEYIYIEGTTTPFVFNKVPLFLRKPETVRKTTPELLSAALRNIYFFFGGGGVERTVTY